MTEQRQEARGRKQEESASIPVSLIEFEQALAVKAF